MSTQQPAMQIPANLVKELRERTGAGFSDCRAALVEAEGDIEKIYRLQANCYLTKPVDFDAFEDLVKSASNFWLMMVRLPPQMRVG